MQSFVLFGANDCARLHSPFIRQHGKKQWFTPALFLYHHPAYNPTFKNRFTIAPTFPICKALFLLTTPRTSYSALRWSIQSCQPAASGNVYVSGVNRFAVFIQRLPTRSSLTTISKTVGFLFLPFTERVLSLPASFTPFSLWVGNGGLMRWSPVLNPIVLSRTDSENTCCGLPSSHRYSSRTFLSELLLWFGLNNALHLKNQFWYHLVQAFCVNQILTEWKDSVNFKTILWRFSKLKKERMAVCRCANVWTTWSNVCASFWKMSIWKSLQRVCYGATHRRVQREEKLKAQGRSMPISLQQLIQPNPFWTRLSEDSSNRNYWS